MRQPILARGGVNTLEAPVTELAEFRFPLSRLWQKVCEAVIVDVPESLAACEFHCREPECAHGDSLTCQKRLNGMRSL